MRVFVGTMESGEADFDDCQAAIRRQTHKDVYHFVVSGLPEPEAHAALYEMWERVKSHHDLFLKVDADTVLAHDNVIAEHVALFAANPHLTGTQAWLYDYMTDGKIFGLGCMRNTVTLTKSTNPLYPDRVDEKHDQVLRGDALPAALNPAGNHCMHPTDRQAFHYGLHRTLKNQHENMDRVRAGWNRQRDRARALALLGAQAAPQFRKNLKFNYGDLEFHRAFQDAIDNFDERVKAL
jgi:hypothetical protein